MKLEECVIDSIRNGRLAIQPCPIPGCFPLVNACGDIQCVKCRSCFNDDRVVLMHLEHLYGDPDGREMLAKMKECQRDVSRGTANERPELFYSLDSSGKLRLDYFYV